MSVILMEEHYHAYFAWKSHRVQNAWCWHVDAHLDIGRTGLSEERLRLIKNCRTPQEVLEQGALGNSYLPWGGLHCGNYIYPAIKEGIVGKLTWVLPPDLPEAGLLTWAKHHLNEWFELSPQEFRSLSYEGRRVHGTLLGIPFEMGPLEALELPEEPVLLDIDVDYFLNDDGTVWQESDLFARAIRSVPSLLTTVAYSVKGGFTPDAQRRLAKPWLENDVIRSEAEEYFERPLDKLAARVRCRQYEDALLELDDLANPGVEELYLKGTSLHALKKYEGALEVWNQILALPGLSEDGQLYLHNLCAELLLTLGRPDDSLKHSLTAQKLDRKAYAPCWTEAQAREVNGDVQKTIKALRKAARLSEDTIYGLKIRTALIRLYKRQGKEGLAMAEARKLHQIDPDGRVAAFANMGI